MPFTGRDQRGAVSLLEWSFRGRKFISPSLLAWETLWEGRPRKESGKQTLSPFKGLRGDGLAVLGTWQVEPES